MEKGCRFSYTEIPIGDGHVTLWIVPGVQNGNALCIADLDSFENRAEPLIRGIAFQVLQPDSIVGAIWMHRPRVYDQGGPSAASLTRSLDLEQLSV